jgi:hypothetical protein
MRPPMLSGHRFREAKPCLFGTRQSVSLVRVQGLELRTCLPGPPLAPRLCHGGRSALLCGGTTLHDILVSSAVPSLLRRWSMRLSSQVSETANHAGEVSRNPRLHTRSRTKHVAVRGQYVLHRGALGGWYACRARLRNRRFPIGPGTHGRIPITRGAVPGAPVDHPHPLGSHSSHSVLCTVLRSGQ